MGIIVCESEFITKDRKNPDYAFTEIDFYAWTPSRFVEEENHRLTLKKNLKTNKYELWKIYKDKQETVLFFKNPKRPNEIIESMITTNIDTGKDKMVFSHKDLQVVLEEANGLWNKFHSTDDYTRTGDIVCEHKYPNVSSICQFDKSNKELREVVKNMIKNKGNGANNDKRNESMS